MTLPFGSTYLNRKQHSSNFKDSEVQAFNTLAFTSTNTQKSSFALGRKREREEREKRERESAQERKNRRRERRVEKREKRESGCGRGKYRQKGFVCIFLPLLVLLLLLEMRLFQYAIRTCVFPTNEVVSPLTYRFESILKKKRKTRERIKTRMEKCNFLFSSCCPMEGGREANDDGLPQCSVRSTVEIA